MKFHRLFLVTTLLAGGFTTLSPALAQGTAFTYQGRLITGGTNANGSYDLTFALFTASSGGVQVGGTLTNAAVGVSDGLFTLPLDFGFVFNGTPYWLQIGVRTNGVGAFTALSPRQQLTPVPYAITAENVDGSVSASQLTGTLGPGLFPIPLDLTGSTATPLFEADQAGTGTAIYGTHASTAGTSAAVQGDTASTAAAAYAVYGLVSSTSPGGFSAAVRGQNNGTGGLGIGVWGSQAGSGWGVYGTAASGIGVNASGGSGIGLAASGGTGVSASGSTGSGVDATASSTAGIGVAGTHSATDGTAAGVQGTTASTASLANAVYGLVSSTSPGGFSAAVRGENRGAGGLGIGVYASHAGSGWGVYATSVSGIGVVASGDTAVSASGAATGVSASGATGVLGTTTTGDGVVGTSSAVSGRGLVGSHSATSGTAAGIQGNTASADGFANAVYGLVSSTSPGGFSAAVRGENRGTNGSGIGVYGSQAGSGWGVYATSASGVGLVASGSTAVSASGSSTGVYAAGSGSALTIGSGAIHVSGAGVGTSTAAFIHRAVAGNISSDFTVINNSQCNGDPDAILIVTQNWNPASGGGVYNVHHVGVFYTGSNWAIFNEDQTAMVVNTAYNVLVIKN
jgi:hypothetical protein